MGSPNLHPPQLISQPITYPSNPYTTLTSSRTQSRTTEKPPEAEKAATQYSSNIRTRARKVKWGRGSAGHVVTHSPGARGSMIAPLVTCSRQLSRAVPPKNSGDNCPAIVLLYDLLSRPHIYILPADADLSRIALRGQFGRLSGYYYRRPGDREKDVFALVNSYKG